MAADGRAAADGTAQIVKPYSPVQARATATGRDSAVAIVSVDGHAPTVYADITTDDGYWYQVDTLDIVCPCGRRWS